MAYLNEFPHFESNKLNLDWLLEQYSTFNDRIEEIKTAFNEAVEQFETDLQDFETDVNTAISNFETNVNGIISDFKTETNEEISEFETTVTNEINSLTTNMITYVSEHMNEWQVAAAIGDNGLLKLSNDENPGTTSYEISRIQVGNIIYPIEKEISYTMSFYTFSNWSGGDDFNISQTLTTGETSVNAFLERVRNGSLQVTVEYRTGTNANVIYIENVANYRLVAQGSGDNMTLGISTTHSLNATPSVLAPVIMRVVSFKNE